MSQKKIKQMRRIARQKDAERTAEPETLALRDRVWSWILRVYRWCRGMQLVPQATWQKRFEKQLRRIYRSVPASERESVRRPVGF